jgi:hypothetical protein
VLTEHLLKRKALGKAFLLLNGHRAHCSLFETAAENNVAIVLLPSHSARTVQPLDKLFWGGP